MQAFHCHAARQHAVRGAEAGGGHWRIQLCPRVARDHGQGIHSRHALEAQGNPPTVICSLVVVHSRAKLKKQHYRAGAKVEPNRIVFIKRL